MFSSIKRLFIPRRLGHPDDSDVLVFAKLNLNPNSDVEVNFKYGDILPDSSIASALFTLILYQAANIRVNLITEPDLIRSAYSEMMVDLLEHWPDGSIEQTGDFFKTLSMFRRIVVDNDFLGTVWAANGGETIELKLARKQDNSLWLYDYYPGMQGYGPQGLAINLTFHFIFLVDFVTAIFDDATCKNLGQALSEFWLTHLRLDFDTPYTVDRQVLYGVADAILEQYRRDTI